MDADLPTPDRVDLDPYEVDEAALAADDDRATVLADDGGDLAGGTEAPDDAVPHGDEDVDVVSAERRGDDDATAASEPAGEDDRLDLDAISADLEGVEAALVRLGDGTYWTDEVTGEPLPDELLAAHPTARRA
jgi:RNA polymerase-binding transcription factor DksA